MNPELLLELRERIEATGLSAHSDAITAQARPALDLMLDGASQGKIGEHRFGGAPDLPPSIAWPRDEEGRAFVFLLQLNLAQAPAFEASPLPSSGMMWLFVGLDEPATDVAHRIVFWQGDEELQPVAPPSLDEFIDDAYAEMAPLRLRLEARADVPNYSTGYGGLEDELSEEEMRALDELARHKKDCIGQLLGHARGIGQDPREDAFVVREVGKQFLYDYAKRQTLDMSRAHAWQNLLHLSSFSSGEVDFCVWDAGYLIFLIREDDLQKFELARVYAAVESS